jgi:molybdate transport system substrate-binding protein
MRRQLVISMALLGLTPDFSAPSVWAHHAFSAEYDASKDVTVRGTVTKMEWVNPHASFYIEVKQPGGPVEEWKIQIAPPQMLLARGLTKDTVKIGTAVTIAGYRARDGSLHADGELMTLANGKTLNLGSGLFIPLSSPVPAPIRVLSSNGVKAAAEELKTVLSRALGRPVEIEFSTTRSLQQRIEAGEAFDVALLTKESMDSLVRQGQIAASAHQAIARTGIGVGFRKGAPKPDIRTPDALKRTLLNAKSVAYTIDGASRPAIDRMFASLGIAGEMEKKTLLEPAGQSPVRVAEGKAQFVLTLTSEILPVPGIELAGPLPAQFQSDVVFEAGLSAKAKNSDDGKALVQLLAAPTAAAFFKAKGMGTGR